MKRIVIMLLVCLLAFSFVACNKSNENNNSSDLDNSSDNIETSSTVSVYDNEDEQMTSSELEEIVDEFTDKIEVTLTPSKEETSSDNSSHTDSSTVTSSSDVSSTDSSSSEESSTDVSSSEQTSSEPIWIGPF